MTVYALTTKDIGGDIKGYVAKTFPLIQAFIPQIVPTADPDTLCIFDRLNGSQVPLGSVVESKPLLLSLSGWVAIKAPHAPGSRVTIVLADLDRSKFFRLDTTERFSREDVAKDIGRPEQNQAGFVVRTAITMLDPGDYAVYVGQTTSDNVERWCGPITTLRVQD